MLITVGRTRVGRGSERVSGRIARRITGKTKPYIGEPRRDAPQPRREVPPAPQPVNGHQNVELEEDGMTATPVRPGIDEAFEAIIAKIKPYEDPVPVEGDQPKPAPEEEGGEEKADDKD